MKLSDHTTHYQRDAELFDYFDERSGADRDSTRRIQQGVFHAAKPAADDLLLDIGSGNGWLADECRAHKLRAPVLADIGIANLRKLRAKLGASALLVAADAYRLPFRDGSFHCVIASEVLEHLNEPADALSEARRVLVENGRIVVSTPYREKLRYSLCIHCNQSTPLNAHLHSFDEARHTALMREAGFGSVRLQLLVNKLLMYSRVSLLLSFLPFRLWRGVDAIVNLLLRKCAIILVSAHALTRSPSKRTSTQ
jgi:ubiquinone/menaquinone biosynthesis C-methylase UbiE